MLGYDYFDTCRQNSNNAYLVEYVRAYDTEVLYMFKKEDIEHIEPFIVLTWFDGKISFDF